MEKPMDRAVWETLEDLSHRIEALITVIENNVGESDERSNAIKKLNGAYQDLVSACGKDQDQRKLNSSKGKE